MRDATPRGMIGGVALRVICVAIGAVSLASVAAALTARPVHVRSDLAIAAPPERVWSVLAETHLYPDWNPFIRALDGPWRVGGRLRLFLSDPDDRTGATMVFHPVLLTLAPGSRLIWRGRLWGVPGLLTGRHDIRLEPRGSGTLLVQEEVFSGVLLWVWDPRPLSRAFDAMNRALASRVGARREGS